jgi:hypothetical protein
MVACRQQPSPPTSIVSAGQPGHGSSAKVAGVALKFDRREKIGEHRGEQPYVDSDRAQRALTR